MKPEKRHRYGRVVYAHTILGDIGRQGLMIITILCCGTRVAAVNLSHLKKKKKINFSINHVIIILFRTIIYVDDILQDTRCI